MGATAVLRAALAAAFATAAPASSRGALACLRSCADSLAYPPDARAHFDEIHRALDNYSHVSYARLAGYRGPWIENRWIAATRADLARADTLPKRENSNARRAIRAGGRRLKSSQGSTKAAKGKDRLATHFAPA